MTRAATPAITAFAQIPTCEDGGLVLFAFAARRAVFEAGAAG